KTSQASQEYLNSLNETKMMFSTYDENGNKVKTKLTGAALSQYAPLKNQYTLVNTDGQALVSELDATNYKESANISEFLEKYGFSNIFEEKVSTVVNEGKLAIANDKYQKAYDEWQAKRPNKDDFYNIKYKEEINDELYQKFLKGEGSCGSAARDGDYTCYLHVLTHLLDQWLAQDGNGNSYDSANYPNQKTQMKTSTGRDVNIDYNYISGAGISQTPDLIPVSKAIMDTSNPDTTYYAAGTMGKDLKPDATEKERLLSDYYYDKNGVLQKKLLKDKIVDMYYVLNDHTNSRNPNAQNLLKTTDAEVNALYLSFQEDMKLKKKTPYKEPDNDGYKKAFEDWQKEEPEKPDEKDFHEEITTLDQTQQSDEGQWYINLWHRMNGASNYKVTINGVDNGEHDPKSDGVISGDNIKSPTNGLTENGKVLWTVLEDGLMNSDEWINYALKNRVVTMERVNYTNPTENGTGIKEYTWTSIIYSNALDISEEENEKAITEAEVKYKQTLSDIESKDKQYDNIIRRLDTEHNALQTEYETIKSVISKNLERTLKMYS
ncbi:MAG: hypothetical protein MRZ62_07475, partial [Brachyspira sp.]|nr:hypothetical protein [Brachyspira sp.]